MQGLPVIVSCGETPDYQLVRTLKPDIFLAKPFDVRELVTRVKSLVAGSISLSGSLVSFCEFRGSERRIV